MPAWWRPRPTYKPTQEGLYQHFLAISRAVPLPLILYNVPGRTAVDILPETVEKLADLDTVIAIKEASDLERGKQLVQRVVAAVWPYSRETTPPPLI